jgi:hypothetical protein
MPDECGGDSCDRERAALRAYFGALEEACRTGRELEALLDLLQGEERRDTIAEILDRIEHLHDVARELRRR